jgi:hypothetical protein
LEPGGKRSIRGAFEYNKTMYKFDVTDPRIEAVYLEKKDGHYIIDNPYMCISLSEPFEGYCYKLIAALTTEDVLSCREESSR